jgi:hypothetical protein
VLTSETTKRKVSNQFSLIDHNNFTYSVGGDAVQMIKHSIFSDLFKKNQLKNNSGLDVVIYRHWIDARG